MFAAGSADLDSDPMHLTLRVSSEVNLASANHVVIYEQAGRAGFASLFAMLDRDKFEQAKKENRP